MLPLSCAVHCEGPMHFVLIWYNCMGVYGVVIVWKLLSSFSPVCTWIVIVVVLQLCCPVLCVLNFDVHDDQVCSVETIGSTLIPHTMLRQMRIGQVFNGHAIKAGVHDNSSKFKIVRLLFETHPIRIRGKLGTGISMLQLVYMPQTRSSTGHTNEAWSTQRQFKISDCALALWNRPYPHSGKTGNGGSAYYS